jgi:hypothetical protein
MTKFFTAICFDHLGKPYKYRKIQNKPYQLQKFEDFCRSKNIKYINYYDRETKLYIKRANLSIK